MVLEAKGASMKMKGNIGSGVAKSPQADIWVTKWVDYSSKYGLGYLLLNGSTGVYFNDSTKIILSPCGTYFDYIERSAPGGGGPLTGSGLMNGTGDMDNGR